MSFTGLNGENRTNVLFSVDFFRKRPIIEYGGKYNGIFSDNALCVCGKMLFSGEIILTDYIREKEWLYRALRTFFQAFVSSLAAQLMMRTDADFDKKVIFSVVVSSLAAGIAAVMNADKKEGEEIE